MTHVQSTPNSTNAMDNTGSNVKQVLDVVDVVLVAIFSPKQRCVVQPTSAGSGVGGVVRKGFSLHEVHVEIPTAQYAYDLF